MSRMEHTINNLSNIVMNTKAARSRINDADIAAESTELANTSPQSGGPSHAGTGEQSPAINSATVELVIITKSFCKKSSAIHSLLMRPFGAVLFVAV